MDSKEVLERALAQCREAREELAELADRDVRGYWVRFKAMNKKIITEINTGTSQTNSSNKAEAKRKPGEVAPIVIRPSSDGEDAKIIIRWRRYPNSVKRLKGSTKKPVNVRAFGESVPPKKDGHYSLAQMKRICEPWEYSMVKDFESRFIEHRESLNSIHESIKGIKSAIRKITKHRETQGVNHDD